MKIEINITELENTDKNLIISDVSDSTYEKGVKYIQDTYCKRNNEQFMLLGNVAELVKILTGRELDLDVPEYYH
jgi:hypothetical protein